MDPQERTLYCGNLSPKVTRELLYELFLQAGPLAKVTIPKDKDGNQRTFGFIEFRHSVSVQYAVALLNGTSLYGRILRLDPRVKSKEENPYLKKLDEYFSSQKGMLQAYGSQNDGRFRGDSRYSQYDRPHSMSDRSYSQGSRSYSHGGRSYSQGDYSHSQGDHSHSQGYHSQSHEDRSHSQGDRSRSQDDRRYSRDDRGYSRDDSGHSQSDRRYSQSERRYPQDDRRYSQDDRRGEDRYSHSGSQYPRQDSRHSEKKYRESRSQSKEDSESNANPSFVSYPQNFYTNMPPPQMASPMHMQPRFSGESRHGSKRSSYSKRKY